MKKPNNYSVVSILAAFFCVGCLSVVSAMAQSSDGKSVKKGKKRSMRSRTRNDSDLLSVFKSLAISASDSTVKIQSGNRQIAVGTIVDASGLVLTKASEMRGELECRLPNGDVIPASVFGIDVENDLALLKIDADGLAEAPLQATEPPTQGMWLVSPTDQNGALTVGVVGVNERKIPPSRAFIGIQMLNGVDDGGVLITKVEPNSPAKKSKLRADDVIVKIDATVVKNSMELVEVLGTYSPGSQIALTIKREDKNLVIKLILADAQKTSDMHSRSRTQNSMGSHLSPRGKDFPRAFQHDMALERNQCGGPVVNLEGQIVGINIARAGRVSSLAIPIDAVLSVVEKLKTGEFSPVNVYADRIKSSEEELTEMRDELLANKAIVDESKEGFETHSAKIEELERMKREIAQRIKDVFAERDKLSKTRRVLKSKNGEAERAIRRLETQLNALKAGKKY